MENSLSISEKLFLLSIHPEKGGMMSNAGYTLDYSIIAGCLFEMVEHGLIRISGNRVEILTKKTTDPIEGIILGRFAQFNDPLKLSRWFNRLSCTTKNIKTEIKLNLSGKRLIRFEDRKFLFFKWKKVFLAERMVVRELASDVERQIFFSDAGSPRDNLIALVEPAGLMPRLFADREKRREARRRLKQICPDNEITIALKRAISATRAAAVS